MKSRFLYVCAFLVAAGAFTGFAIPQEKKERVDLVIAGGTVVTMDADRRILEDGAVAVKADQIVAVGKRAEIEAKYAAAAHIDAAGHLVLPGFINGHTHVPMTLLRGLKDDVTLDVWLKNYIFPAEAKNVTEEFVRWGTRLAAAARLRTCIISRTPSPKKPKPPVCAGFSARAGSTSPFPTIRMKRKRPPTRKNSSSAGKVTR